MYERRESASFITGTVTKAILCLVSESSQHVEDGYAFLFDCPVYNFGGARHASLSQQTSSVSEFTARCEPNACGGFIR